MNKIKALVQWFVRLELQHHKHWCTPNAHGVNDGRCEHQMVCWYCKGVFCANQERKDCPECVRRYKEAL